MMDTKDSRGLSSEIVGKTTYKEQGTALQFASKIVLKREIMHSLQSESERLVIKGN